MPSRRTNASTVRSTVFTLGTLGALLAAWILYQNRFIPPAAPPDSFSGPGNPPQSEAAFRITHLYPAAGVASPFHTGCVECHAKPDAFPRARWDAVSKRSQLKPSAWALAANLTPHCGACHAVPGPASLGHTNWIEVFDRMGTIRTNKGLPALTADQRSDLLHYYLTFSPASPPALAADPPVSTATRLIRITHGTPFGTPRPPDTRFHPMIGNLRIVDLQQNGHPGVIVCDTESSRVNWIHPKGRTNSGTASVDWIEDTLAAIPHPSRAHAWTNSATGRIDLIAAAQTRIDPTEDPVGRVVWMRQQPDGTFTNQTLVEGLGRVADVAPGDFNADGRMDFVVAAFGFLRTGEIGMLENRGTDQWSYRTVVSRTGAIEVIPVDLDGDGRLDFVALFGQEHERISAFLNDGRGGFRERILFEAGTPAYGSAGISLVDLDGDGDLDILYTNGDAMDLATRTPRAFHGVQWLENKGQLRFEWHDIHRIYGAYAAVAEDVDRDGFTDVLVTSLFNDWDDPARGSLFWLRNDGHQRFTAHTLARTPTQLISLAVGTLEAPGTLDVLASGMHGFPPNDRMGRVTRWRITPDATALPPASKTDSRASPR